MADCGADGLRLDRTGSTFRFAWKSEPRPPFNSWLRAGGVSAVTDSSCMGQGCKLISVRWHVFLKSRGIVCTACRRGNWHDNVVAESFLATGARVDRAPALPNPGVSACRRPRLQRGVQAEMPGHIKRWAIPANSRSQVSTEARAVHKDAQAHLPPGQKGVVSLRRNRNAARSIPRAFRIELKRDSVKVQSHPAYGDDVAKPESKRVESDPDDGMPRSIVGEWSLKKHHLLCRYIDTCRATRRKWLDREPAFMDLFCGPGRSRIGESTEVIPGGVIAAAKEAAKGAPFGRFVIADLEPDLVDACMRRMAGSGFTNVDTLIGPANLTVHRAVQLCDPNGLHLAYLDPFSIHGLPFSIIEAIGRGLKRADLFIHFSVMDYRRNLMLMKEDGRLESFAPGWHRVAGGQLSIEDFRKTVFDHWLGLIRSLGYKVSEHIEPIAGTKTADFYWLILASKHPIANRFWNAAADFDQQRKLI